MHFRLEFTGRTTCRCRPSRRATACCAGTPPTASGYREPEVTHLAEVIRELNERFGLGLGTGDEILVYQQVVGLVEDTAMQQVALMNDEARFGQVADDRLDDIVAENAERNTEFMKLYFDNDEFRRRSRKRPGVARTGSSPTRCARRRWRGCAPRWHGRPAGPAR